MNAVRHLAQAILVLGLLGGVVRLLHAALSDNRQQQPQVINNDTEPIWVRDQHGGGVLPGGDVGGDNQASESFSVRFHHRDHPGVLITYSYYAAINEEHPAAIAVERETECMVCTDPDDPGGTEVLSAYRYTTLPDAVPVAGQDQPHLGGRPLLPPAHVPKAPPSAGVPSKGPTANSWGWREARWRLAAHHQHLSSSHSGSSRGAHGLACVHAALLRATGSAQPGPAPGCLSRGSSCQHPTHRHRRPASGLAHGSVATSAAESPADLRTGAPTTTNPHVTPSGPGAVTAPDS